MVGVEVGLGVGVPVCVPVGVDDETTELVANGVGVFVVLTGTPVVGSGVNGVTVFTEIGVTVIAASTATVLQAGAAHVARRLRSAISGFNSFRFSSLVAVANEAASEEIWDLKL